MNKRSIKLVLGLGILALMCPVLVSSEEFEAGKHYKIIEKQSETESNEETPASEETSSEGTDSDTPDADTLNEEIAVVEYFSYGCSHCYRLEPFIDTWLETKGKEVSFSRVAVPRQDWIPYARAFYIAEVLGITEKVHSLIFRGIFVNKQPMGQKRLLKRMYTGVAEVESEKFEEVWASDEIPKLVQNAALEMSDLGITASPTLVVGGTYSITPETAGDLAYMFDVVDFLVEKIKTERETEDTTTANESIE